MIGTSAETTGATVPAEISGHKCCRSAEITSALDPGPVPGSAAHVAHVYRTPLEQKQPKIELSSGTTLQRDDGQVPVVGQCFDVALQIAAAHDVEDDVRTTELVGQDLGEILFVVID